MLYAYDTIIFLKNPIVYIFIIGKKKGIRILAACCSLGKKIHNSGIRTDQFSRFNSLLGYFHFNIVRIFSESRKAHVI